MAAAACDSADDGSGDGGDETGGTGTGGSAPTGGTGGTGATDPTGTLLQPSDVGWMNKVDTWNDLGIQGAWYPYGDQYGVAKCTTVGMHPASECSTITQPPPAMMSFPNTGGKMCTTGEVAVILPCVGDVMTSGCAEGKDYSNMWGAGIGFDLNSEGGSLTAPKHVWDPMALAAPSGPIIGFEFEIDTVPLQGLRVEIPILLSDAEAAAVTPTPLPPGSTTDDHPDGAPYWGASSTYPNSPVLVGKNRVTWDLIKPPRTNYTFETSKILGVQFHVPAVTSPPKGAYNFCISNVKMLRM